MKPGKKPLRKSADPVAGLAQDFFDSNPAITFIKDIGGRYLHVNQRFLQAFNVDAAAVIGRTDDEIFDAAQAAQFRHNDRTVLDTEKTLSVEQQLRHADGPHTSITTGFLLRDTRGRPCAIGGIITDITGRKSAEDRFRTTFEQATVGIVHSSLDDHYLLANQRFCDMLGYSPGEISGMGSRDIAHPEDQGKDLALHGKLLRGEIGSFSGEKRYRRKDGTTFWVNRTVSLARDKDGTPLYLIRVIEDITRRKEEEDLFRATFDQSAIGIALTLPSGKYLTVNNRLCEMLGYTREELLAKSALDDITHPDDRAGSKKRTAQLLSGETPHVYAEKRYVRKDGGVIHITRSMSLVHGPDGEPRYIISMITDVTDHKTAEDLFTASFEQAGVGMSLRQPGQRTSPWLRVNQKFCDMLGYTRDELMQMNTAAVTPPEDQDAASDYNARVLRGEISGYSRERRYVRRDGRIIWCNVSISVVRGPDGKPSHIIAVAQDITARKQIEAQLEQTFEQAAVGIVRTDLDRRIITTNRKFCEMIGYTREELIGTRLRQISHSDDRNRDAEARQRLIRGEIDHLQSERRYVRKDGEVIWVRRTTSLARDVISDAEEYIFVVEDITARKLIEDSYRTTFDHAPIGIMHSTTDRRILHVNPKLCEILGYTREELLGMTTADFLPAEYRESDRPKYLEPMLRGELQSYSSERPFIRKDGTIVWTHRTISLVRDSAGQPRFFLRIIEDISERKQTSERLARLAHYDSITRLPNRVLFHDRLGQSIAQARRNNRFVGVLFLDLDRFKLVNDTLGHAAGDQLLKKVAERLTQALRPSDTVGRLSGDEFAVILPELTVPQHAGFVAQKLIDMLKAPFDLDGNEVFVTASIGITLYPFDSDNIEMLIRDADAAMYSAKAAGRNTYQFYTTEMNQRATEKLRLETGLRRAIEREEFVLHYQPKVEVVSGKITGLEALLRWQAPDGSVMGPDQFIPLLEETGLIVPVGNWVVRSACAQLHAWHEAGVTPVPVAVNLSARQLRQPGFSATLGDALAEFDVPAKLVEIEITESSLMENPEQAIVALTEIESLGIRLSADDFGTGYSSLSYLKRLPLDALKIDRSFVRDITIDPDDAAITRTVITLAHGLGLRVVAEGVETEEQFAFLRENHCDEAQGYLFSQPLPADACTGLLASGNTLRQGTPEAADQQPAVLVVDDDRDHLLLTRLLLQQDGHHVIDTTSTRDAFELLATRRVDIIVSDQSMPGMDGVEFLRRVKLMYPHAMRIMLSGAGDFDAATAAINEGEVHKFFIKGRDEELLRREIGKKFRQGGAFPAEHQAAP